MTFYKMERGWLDSDVFGGEPYTEREAWAWMIGEAHYIEVETPLLGRRVKLKRGQFSHSIRFMADKFKWSKNKVDRFLKKLELWDMIQTESGTGQNIITICNYSKYQDNNKKSGTDTGTGAGQERDKDKEILEYQEGEEAAAHFSEKELTQMRNLCPSLSDREFNAEIMKMLAYEKAHGFRTPEKSYIDWLMRAESGKPKRSNHTGISRNQLAMEGRL